MTTRRRTATQPVAVVALALWFCSVTLVSAYLIASHRLTLPAPAVDDPALNTAIQALLREDRSRLLVLHFLFKGCGCSERVLSRLLATTVRPGVRERVVLVDDPARGDDATLRAAGFEVEHVESPALERRYGVRAVPILVVARRSSMAAVYVGGYTDRKQSQRVRDREVIADIDARRSPPVLPTFGCAVAQSLQRAVDPLGLRR